MNLPENPTAYTVRETLTVTEAEIEAAWSVLERDGLLVLERFHVRAALEAAREVRNAAH